MEANVTAAIRAATQRAVEFVSDAPPDPAIEEVGAVIQAIVTSVADTYNAAACILGIPSMQLRERPEGSISAPYFVLTLENQGGLSLALTTDEPVQLQVTMSALEIYDAAWIHRTQEPITIENAAAVIERRVEQWLLDGGEVETQAQHARCGCSGEENRHV